LHTVVFSGAAGTVTAAGMGLVSNDLKRILAYSTMSQIAYMFVGVGVAVYSAGMFHLLEHAFFKALLFMGAGAVMHALHETHDLDIQRLGGLKDKLPFAYWTFLIGVLAIIGFPGFSGFFSKEDVVSAAYSRALHGDSILWIAWGLTVLTAFLTAVYMFRLFFLVFHGKPRDDSLHSRAEDNADWTMRIAMGILAVLSVIGGFLTFPGAWNEMDAWLLPVFHAFPVRGPAIEPQTFEPISMVAVLAATGIGFWIAWTVYYRGSIAPQRVVAMAPALYRFMAQRYYVDQLYDALFVRTIKWTARILYRFFEIDVIDYTVDGMGRLARYSSGRLRGVQTGYVRNYGLAILFGAVVLVGFYVVGGR
jgi:NADH-quinone oxidoreductase subunit L